MICQTRLRAGQAAAIVYCVREQAAGVGRADDFPEPVRRRARARDPSCLAVQSQVYLLSATNAPIVYNGRPAPDPPATAAVHGKASPNELEPVQPPTEAQMIAAAAKERACPEGHRPCWI